MSNSKLCPCKCHDRLQVPQCGFCCYGGGPAEPVAPSPSAEQIVRVVFQGCDSEDLGRFDVFIGGVTVLRWVFAECANSVAEGLRLTLAAHSAQQEQAISDLRQEVRNAAGLILKHRLATQAAESQLSDLRKQVEERGRMIAAASAVLNDKDFSLVEKLAAAESQLERLSQRIVRQAETIEQRQAAWHEMQSQLEVMRLALQELVDVAENIRHWHDWGKNEEGMVVSSEGVRKLWAATSKAQKFLSSSTVDPSAAALPPRKEPSA